VTAKADLIRSERGYVPVPVQEFFHDLPGRLEFLDRHLPPAPARVLDVGCATGYIGEALTARGYQVTGLELNTRMVEEARGRGIDVVQHDLEEPLPLPDASFDAAHACEVIEHIYDTGGLLRELHRVLVPGGVLVLSTPNLNSLRHRVMVLLGKPAPMWGAYIGDHHGDHIRVLNKAKTFQLLRHAGFRPEAVQGCQIGRLQPVMWHLPTLAHMILVKATRGGDE
jgi:2-polyprenyl-3-methyl-5-hydroxy-6-metoxy-1,4-benzoquinol methylase